MASWSSVAGSTTIPPPSPFSGARSSALAAPPLAPRDAFAAFVRHRRDCDIMRQSLDGIQCKWLARTTGDKIWRRSASSYSRRRAPPGRPSFSSSGGQRFDWSMIEQPPANGWGARRLR